MNTQKMFGNLSKAFIVNLKKDFLIYAFSNKYRKTVNTHMFSSRSDAIGTMKEINT